MVFPLILIISCYLKFVILIIRVLVRVAFLTLFEQKVISYSQTRKGPIKVGFKGILQPFRDAIKLFMKEVTVPSLANFFVYLVSPALALGLILRSWLVYPSSLGEGEIGLGIIFIIRCLSAGVYSLLGAGWSSNSKYALLGSLRAVAQTISYEVRFSIILLRFVVLSSNLRLRIFIEFKGVWLGLLSVPLALIWFISSLAETRRTPFDFTEGESEIVSGFNTEYRAGPFALYFLAEYGRILFMGILFRLIFIGGVDVSVFFYIKICFVLLLFIWVRTTLPRMRYDKLINLAWVVFLPVSISYLIFFVGLARCLV